MVCMAWVAQKFLFTKRTIQNYLCNSEAQIFTLARAIVFLVGLYPSNYIA